MSSAEDLAILTVPVDVEGTLEVPITDITEGSDTLTGAGVFDVLMKAVDTHLQLEFKDHRIDGSMYSSAYIQAIQMVIQGAISYGTEAKKLYWEAKLAEANCRKAEAEIRATLAGIDATKAQIEQTKAQTQAIIKEIELKEAQIEGQRLQNALLEKQMMLSVQQILSEQAKTQDKIGYVNPDNPTDATTIFTRTYDIGGTEGAAMAVQNVQAEEVQKGSIRAMAEHYLTSFNTNQTTLTDLKPSAFGYNGSRVKAAEDLLLRTYGLDPDAIDAAADASSDREEETE